MKIKTIDVDAKEWYDKVNGNSYCSVIVTVNYRLKGEQTFKVPFQYGYGEFYIQAAGELLVKEKIVNMDKRTALWRYCEENNIILRTSKQENCLKREVVAYGANNTRGNIA